jgi:hypothetical protein
MDGRKEQLLLRKGLARRHHAEQQREDDSKKTAELAGRRATVRKFPFCESV